MLLRLQNRLDSAPCIAATRVAVAAAAMPVVDLYPTSHSSVRGTLDSDVCDDAFVLPVPKCWSMCFGACRVELLLAASLTSMEAVRGIFCNA